MNKPKQTTLVFEWLDQTAESLIARVQTLRLSVYETQLLAGLIRFAFNHQADASRVYRAPDRSLEVYATTDELSTAAKCGIRSMRRGLGYLSEMRFVQVAGTVPGGAYWYRIDLSEISNAKAERQIQPCQSTPTPRPVVTAAIPQGSYHPPTTPATTPPTTTETPPRNPIPTPSSITNSNSYSGSSPRKKPIGRTFEGGKKLPRFDTDFSATGVWRYLKTLRDGPQAEWISRKVGLNPDEEIFAIHVLAWGFYCLDESRPGGSVKSPPGAFVSGLYGESDRKDFPGFPEGRRWHQKATQAHEEKARQIVRQMRPRLVAT